MTVIPSKTTTAGQIDKAVANYRALLEKHAGEFNTEAVQTVLGQSELASDQFAIFRKRVEAVSDLFVRIVKVDRTRTPKKVLDATGRKQYISDDVVVKMPKGEGEGDEVEVVFFKPAKEFYKNGVISDEDLEEAYALGGLVPADVYSQAAVNEADPAFADEYPNGTHWKDKNDKWCFAAFYRGGVGERGVRVHRRDVGWRGIWFFAGVRK